MFMCVTVRDVSVYVCYCEGCQCLCVLLLGMSVFMCVTVRDVSFAKCYVSPERKG